MPKDDVYYFHQTPNELAKELIDIISLEQGDKVLEPFRGEGAFYNHFPDNTEKFWCEKEDGVDFRDFKGEIDWVISNPPFRIDDEAKGKRVNSFYAILKHYSTMVKKGIAFLGNDNCFSALTPKRLKELSNNGLYIHKIVVCSIKKWRGRYFYIIFKKEPCDFYSSLEKNF